MAALSLDSMRGYLGKSISSLNQNKLRGLLAEVDLRRALTEWGFGDRVSPGGWILRTVGDGQFGAHTIVVFPETIHAEVDYAVDRAVPSPSPGLHSIASVFRSTGITPYFCTATITEASPDFIRWQGVELGLPSAQPLKPFPQDIAGFSDRDRRYNFLRYSTDTSGIPAVAVPEEFSKEHLRIAFQNRFLGEISDVDGVLYGSRFTYPVEIKEKTAARNNKLGEYFGLDLGPFTKLAFYAAKKGNLNSLFIVREINNVTDRQLVDWWFITFEQLAQFASWVQQGGGTSMTGGMSAVVTIPKSAFTKLAPENLAKL